MVETQQKFPVGSPTVMTQRISCLLTSYLYPFKIVRRITSRLRLADADCRR